MGQGSMGLPPAPCSEWLSTHREHVQLTQVMFFKSKAVDSEY